MRRNSRVAPGLLAVIVAALLPSCTQAFSVDRELKLGREVSKEVEKQMPLSKNEKWQQDVQEMGKRFLPCVTRKEIPYTFRIVDAKDEVNAFSLPGGYVYFSERMWRIMTPDERAGIMGHEIAHSDQRHAVDQMIKNQRNFLWTLPLTILSGGGFGGYAIALGNLAIAMRYSRKMEREADELGIRLTSEAGYNPAGAVTAMKKLLHMSSEENRYEVSDMLASHPDTRKRIDYLAQQAIKLGADPASLELRAVDDPTRIGNVTSKIKDTNMVAARTSAPLGYSDTVTIKKVLWDDEVQALRPRPVASGVVLVPGNHPTLVLKAEQGFEIVDVAQGDGVYPPSAAPPEPAGNPAPGPTGNPEPAEGTRSDHRARKGVPADGNVLLEAGQYRNGGERKKAAGGVPREAEVARQRQRAAEGFLARFGAPT